MSNNDIITKIKGEIDRRIAQIDGETDGSSEDVEVRIELVRLYRFISTLEEDVK